MLFMKKVAFLLNIAMLTAAAGALAESGASTTIEARKGFIQDRNAEWRDTRTDVKGMREGVKGDIREKRVELHSGVTDKRIQMMNASSSDERKAVQGEVHVMREAFWKNAIAERDTLRQDIKTRREAARTKIEADRKKLQTKLATIKDERKKAVVERLDQRFVEINDKMTDQFNDTADRLEDLSSKLQGRIKDAATAGKDVTTAQTALDKVPPKITELRSMITAQAGKTYPMSITTEGKLGSVASSTRESLHKDLQTIRQKIEEVRLLVRDVIFALGNLNAAGGTTATTTSQ